MRKIRTGKLQKIALTPGVIRAIKTSPTGKLPRSVSLAIGNGMRSKPIGPTIGAAMLKKRRRGL